MNIRISLHNLSMVFESISKIVVPVIIIVSLYALSTVNYLIYHTMVEMIRVGVAWMFFIFLWIKRHEIKNDYLMIIGLTLPVISILVILHTLAFKGMNFFPKFDTDLPTQLWIAERYILSISFLLAPYAIWREENTGQRINPLIYLGGLVGITALVIASLFIWHIFPSCYIDGRGLTLFKIISEYIIIITIFISVGLLESQRRRFDPLLLRWLVFFLLFNALADLAFTTYINVYGLANFLGHMFLLGGMVFLFKAIEVIRELQSPITH